MSSDKTNVMITAQVDYTLQDQETIEQIRNRFVDLYLYGEDHEEFGKTDLGGNMVSVEKIHKGDFLEKRYELSWCAMEPDPVIEFVEKCRDNNIDIPQEFKSVIDSYETIENQLKDSLYDPNFCDVSPLIRFTEGTSKSFVVWPTRENDMRRLSGLFPQFLFSLKIGGLSQGDLLIQYYHKGEARESKGVVHYSSWNKSPLLLKQVES